MITPIAGDYTVGKGLVFFKPNGQEHFEELGDVENFDLTVEVEELERYSNQYGTATLANNAVTQVDASIETTLYQMTARNRALAAGGDRATMAQTSQSGQTLTIAAVQAGGIYEIPALSLSNVAVTDGEATPTAYTAGTDYELDAAAGLIKVLQIPAGAGTGLEVTYDQAEIASGLQVGIGGNPNIRGALRLRGVNDIGAKVLVDLWDVQLRPSGARSYISTEYAQLSLTGRCFVSAAKASEHGTAYRLGMERTL
jgi:hypothetical protein